jgi:lysozyme family protein
MRTVRQIAEDIVAREGGYVDDPDDPGGATKFGVTVGTLRRLGLDLTGDGLVDAADVRRLDRSRAVAIFIRHYFEEPGIGQLPGTLQASVFDMHVNAGSNAVKILQRMLGEMEQSVAADGVIGPRTAAAAAAVCAVDAVLVRDAYGVARRNYYFALADRRPASRKYARSRAGGKGGWIRRAEEFMSAGFRMTAAQFQRRVSAWG